MGRILGIHDGTHNAGAAIIVDGQIVTASDEERFSRQKNMGGFPSLSIQDCLETANLSINDIDRICFAGLVNPNPILRTLRSWQQHWKLDDDKFYNKQKSQRHSFSDWIQFHSPFPRLTENRVFYRPLLTKILQRQLRKNLGYSGKIEIFDHHHCHAASAFYGSGFSDALVVIADGLGDGLCLSVWQGKNGSLQRISSMPFPHSYGLLYSSFTGFLGFRPFRHEGKLTGLAALGNPKNIDIPFPFTGKIARRKITKPFPLHQWLVQFEPYSKEDISAWLQRGIENEIFHIVRYFQEITQNTKLCLAGGLFANVKLNQALAHNPHFKDIFIFPNMGDGGLSVGAAYLASQKRKAFTSPFLGREISNQEVERLLSRQNIAGTKHDIIHQATKTLANGGIIARAVGKMEYGPRALGNRSILAPANDSKITRLLNQKLSRSDFMPFAPIIREENKERCLKSQPNSERAAKWMTINFQATTALRESSPAIVHVDGSLRPQLVNKNEQPDLWELLYQYEKLTGEYALVNTSFNLHEEPIVCSAKEALSTFQKAGLDGLILADHWISGK